MTSTDPWGDAKGSVNPQVAAQSLASLIGALGSAGAQTADPNAIDFGTYSGPAPKEAAPTDSGTQTVSQNIPGGENGGSPSSSGNWVHDILAGIGAPDTPENERVLNAWMRAEGGAGHNNPLNTTQKMPGSTDFNENGGFPVQGYSSEAQGVQATVQTLLNGQYAGIIAALRKGDSAKAVADAIAASPWGTGGLVQQIIGGQ